MVILSTPLDTGFFFIFLFQLSSKKYTILEAAKNFLKMKKLDIFYFPLNTLHNIAFDLIKSVEGGFASAESSEPGKLGLLRGNLKGACQIG